jgi:hypothetical protein
MTFRIQAMPTEELVRTRTRQVDDFGNSLTAQVYEDGGYPLRCCLRESEPGERLLLMAHRPFPWEGVYAEVGPVFVHAEDCGGYRETDSYP